MGSIIPEYRVVRKYERGGGPDYGMERAPVRRGVKMDFREQKGGEIPGLRRARESNTGVLISPEKDRLHAYAAWP
jgi:hypothetical protein